MSEHRQTQEEERETVARLRFWWPRRHESPEHRIVVRSILHHAQDLREAANG